MTLADVNVFVNAFRTDAEDHDRCRGWLMRTIDDTPRFGVAPQVLAAFVRVVTHPRVFRQPSDTDEALRFCDALLSHSRAVEVTPGPGHWELFARMCHESEAAGNLVSDAWFAALAIESGCEWITLDRDYSRFPGLRWRHP